MMCFISHWPFVSLFQNETERRGRYEPHISSPAYAVPTPNESESEKQKIFHFEHVQTKFASLWFAQLLALFLLACLGSA